MRCALALAAGLIALSASLAKAQSIEALIGRTVVSVALDVEGLRSEDPALHDLIETRVGEPLDPRGVRETISHLFGLGRYEDIIVHATAVEGGVALRYELQPVHTVERIAFEGRTAVGADTLRRAIVDRFGASPSPARAAEVINVLDQLYKDYGYARATITSRVDVEHRPERSTLVFSIDAGERMLISAVNVEGNAPPSLADARRRLEIEAGQPYDRRRIQRRIDEYVTSLRRRGYYEAQGDHTVELGKDGRSASLTITIDGGAHIALVFEGDPLPSRVRKDLVPIEREGSVDEDLLEDAKRAIEEYFSAQGYRDAAAPYSRRPAGGDLAIVFRVTRGPEYRVGDYEFTGNSSVPFDDLAPLLRLREGGPFVDTLLDGDVAAIRDLYRRRGFPAAQVVSDEISVPGPPPVEVRVRVTITEGRRTLVDAVTLSGHQALTEDALKSVLLSKAGEPFFEPHVALDRDALVVRYLNAGYRSADVRVALEYNKDRSGVTIRYAITEGPRVFVDHVIIVGNVKTNRNTIRREMTLGPGDPLGFEALAESQRRISALGLFRRVRITELDHGIESRRDLLVSVEEAPATTLGYGGGVEVSRRLVRETGTGAAVERFEAAPRGFFEIGRRNLFGRNRSVNLFTRLSIRLRSDPTLSRDGEQPATDFNEYRVLGTYRQPRLIVGSDFLATGFLEQGVRTSFDFNRRGGRLELSRRLRRTLSVSARYAIDRTEVFNERFADDEDQALIDRLFPQVRLSAVSSAVIRDTRDDPLGPTRGSLLGLDTEVAGRQIGSEVGFVKSFGQAFIYRQLPGRKRLVFATGARLGLAAGFAREAPSRDPDGRPIIGPDGQPVVEVVEDLPASERFFAGGDTTVRGFSLDRLGAPETLDPNGFPRGGNAVLVLNAELRVPVWRDLGAVTFLDAGNVFARVPDLALSDIRGSAGFGFRYSSPIGPLRVDLGFKLDRDTLPNGSRERLTAVHISLGQAF